MICEREEKTLKQLSRDDCIQQGDILKWINSPYDSLQMSTAWVIVNKDSKLIGEKVDKYIVFRMC
jgi:hypothetical protein